MNILEPSQFETVRTVKATDTSSTLSHNPNSLEPQFIEDVQQAIAQPHGAEPQVPLEQIPERLGYLYEVCGIDFGYGPSSMMQWIFEHIHIWGGLGWTASIIAMSVGIRAILVPLMINSAREGVKLKIMSAAVKPIQAQITEAKLKGDVPAMQQLTNELKVTAKAHEVRWWKLLAPIMIQFPLGFAAWRNLRNCATLPVPGFVTESWLWNIDLTFSDAYYAVPAASALLIWASMRVNNKITSATGTGMTNQDAMKLIQAVLPPLSFCFMAFQPGAVQLYFLASSAMGLLTTFFLSLDGVRKFFGMSTVIQPASNLNTPAVGTFMRTRRTVLDVPARTVTDAGAKATIQASNQNISFIDKTIGNVKTTIKKATKPVWDQAKSIEKSQKQENTTEAAKLRSQIEQSRRERNAAFGAQEEKRKR